MKRCTILAAACAAVLCLVSNGYATPGSGAGCSGCHTTARPGLVSVINADATVDVPSDGGFGALPVYHMVPGGTATLQFELTGAGMSSGETYDLRVARFDEGGVVNGETLIYTPDGTWRSRAGGTYFTAPGGVKDWGGPIAFSFNLMADAAAPEDVYRLDVMAAGPDGMWSDGQSFYVDVVPEPATLGLLGLGVASLVIRHRKKGKHRPGT